MSEEKLIWLSGLSLAAGGFLATMGWLLFAIFDPPHRGYLDWWWWPYNILAISGGFFMVLGLPGFYVTHAKQSGLIGLMGFISLFAGLILSYLAVQAIETTTMPNTPAGMMRIVSIAVPSLAMGVILTMVAVWQADVYPQWLAGALLLSLLLGAAKQLYPFPALWEHNLFSMVFTITMGLMGLLMMSLP
jgi:hypothetical protein